MRSDRPSLTASLVAAVRAMYTHLPEPYNLALDPLAASASLAAKGRAPHTAAVKMPPRESKPAETDLVTEVKTQGRILGGFVGLLWVIQIINAVVFQGALARLGVQPRSLAGLWGILLAPFLHLNFAHLIANTVPLLVLGFFVMLRRKRDLLTVSVISALVGGLGTWLIAPAFSVHVGASILIFGYLGYLLSRGIFERRFWPILGSVMVFFLYGGALFGVLPGEVGVSWQGHLFGLLGGILSARLLGRPRLSAVEKTPARRRFAEAGGARVALPVEADVDQDIEAELEKARRAR